MAHQSWPPFFCPRRGTHTRIVATRVCTRRYSSRIFFLLLSFPRNLLYHKSCPIDWRLLFFSPLCALHTSALAPGTWFISVTVALLASESSILSAFLECGRQKLNFSILFFSSIFRVHRLQNAVCSVHNV